MNFGGIQLLYGLLYLVCCMGLTIIYLYCFYILFVAIKKGLYKFRHHIAQNKWIAGRGPSPSEVISPPTESYVNLRYLIKASILVVILLSYIYGNQRYTWMGETSKHHEAKEYWVVGQVVFSHRRLMEFVFHPENILARPYTLIQQSIFNRGISFLPENDGERHVWENTWFLYPYTRKKHRPYGVGSVKNEPKMVPLLDQCWRTMEGMMTKSYSDPSMQRKYFIEFPLLMNYYSLLQGHYTGKLRGAGTIRRKTPYLIERNILLLKWLDTLDENWKKSGLFNELIINYPEILAYRQEIVIWLIQDLALTIVGKGEFDCSHPIIERLYQEYIDAMSNDPNRNFFLLYSEKNLRQAKILYQSSIYGGRGGAANYFLSHLCNKEMPEEKYVVVNRLDNFCKFYPNNRVERVFKEELKGLKRAIK